jgi:2'-5' RNA ligase
MTNMLSRERDRFAVSRPKTDFAVTIAEYGHVKKRIADAIISGVEIGRLVDGLSDDILLDPLYLSIKGTEWFQFSKRIKDARVLVLKFEEDESYDKLTDQFRKVDRALARLGIYGAANDPNNAHITILNYGEYGDKMSMTKAQANKTIEIAEKKRRIFNLGMVAIGPLVIGDGYRKNHHSISNRMESLVPEIDY